MARTSTAELSSKKRSASTSSAPRSVSTTTGFGRLAPPSIATRLTMFVGALEVVVELGVVSEPDDEEHAEAMRKENEC